jgi:hypothetical protein
MSDNTRRKEFDPAVYNKISLDHLITFCVWNILESGEECTLERLVYEAFTFFPERFGFQRYPEWPDSARIDKSWRRCRTDFGFIVGKVKEGFRLTPKGELIAKDTERKLLKGKIKNRSKLSGPTREKYEAVLRQIRLNPLFQTYIRDNDKIEFDEIKLRLLLNCTMETPYRVLRQNLKYFQHVALIYKDLEVDKFLKECENVVKKMR